MRKIGVVVVVSMFALAGCAEADSGSNARPRVDGGADTGSTVIDSAVPGDAADDVADGEPLDSSPVTDATDATSSDGDLDADAAADAVTDDGVDTADTAADALDADAGDTSVPVGSVLIYNDSTDTLADDAVTAMGGTPILTETDTAFTTAFDAGGFSVVVIDAPYDNLSSAMESRLSTWIAGGGRLVFAYWDLDASATMRTALGVSTVSYSAPKAVYTDPASSVDLFSFKQVFPSPLAGAIDDVDDDGDDLTLTGAGFLAARHDSASGPGAIAVVAAGRVIVNGFTPYNFRNVDGDSDGIKDVRELWENEIAYVLTK